MSEDLQKAREIFKKAEEETISICKRKRRFTTSIPRRGDDTDSVIFAAVDTGLRLVNEIERIASENERLTIQNAGLLQRDFQLRNGIVSREFAEFIGMIGKENADLRIANQLLEEEIRTFKSNFLAEVKP